MDNDNLKKDGHCDIQNVNIILPCPFCGSECIIQSTTFGDCMTEYFRVNCKQNDHSLDWWEEDEIKAITVWNQRHCT